MKNKKYKYIYGPVPSWRLGASLGIDPLSMKKKVCSFDCLYCQIGPTPELNDKRQLFVKSEDIIKELSLLPPVKIDYITFAGTGEPTLAVNLGEMIRDIKKIRKEKVAVISNATLLYREDVRQDLLAADLVVAKLDAASQDILKAVNQPIETIDMQTIVSGIKEFKRIYKGKLALQIMFIEQNKEHAQAIAKIAKEINPDEVQINTPLRMSKVKPLPEAELDKLEGYFEGLPIVSVYKAEKKMINSISDEDTLKRRGKS